MNPNTRMSQRPINTQDVSSIIRIAKKLEISCVEEPISPFDLQRVQELFMTNAIVGIQPVSSYRRTTYEKHITLKLQQGLFDWVNSSQDA